MKRIFLNVLMIAFTVSVYSCRESTQEKTEDAVEAMGEDIENAAEEAGDAIQEGADELNDEIYAAIIEPDFNVLPLIAKHFKNRYADQQFVIYDRSRSYGIFYDLNTVQFIELDLDDAVLKEALHDEEMHYDEMWQDYFISTGIKSRINKKLHLRHVPKRYWKYLNEKNPL